MDLGRAAEPIGGGSRVQAGALASDDDLVDRGVHLLRGRHDRRIPHRSHRREARQEVRTPLQQHPRPRRMPPPTTFEKFWIL